MLERRWACRNLFGCGQQSGEAVALQEWTAAGTVFRASSCTVADTAFQQSMPRQCDTNAWPGTLPTPAAGVLASTPAALLATSAWGQQPLHVVLNRCQLMHQVSASPLQSLGEKPAMFHRCYPVCSCLERACHQSHCPAARPSCTNPTSSHSSSTSSSTAQSTCQQHRHKHWREAIGRKTHLMNLSGRRSSETC